MIFRDKMSAYAPSRLTINLSAIQANYRTLCDLASSARTAAVIKADAYGLGAIPVARALSEVGCRTFFTAHLSEAIQVREALPVVEIAVLNGLFSGEEATFREHGLIPVLNDMGQLRQWAKFCRYAGRLEAAIQVDSGMARLGLSPVETDQLLAETDLLKTMGPRYLLSHLACADEPDHPQNGKQLNTFQMISKRLPLCSASLSASAGIFLGPEWHLALVRPGIALYGGAPVPDQATRLKPVIKLQSRILQVREIPVGQAVGYNATFIAPTPTRVATVAIGYADGYLRTLSNQSHAFYQGNRLPILGRVSMDMISLDVSGAPDLEPGDYVDLMNDELDINRLATMAGTIPNEILTGLGTRFQRSYLTSG
ncbi:MAG: alanine racemase [Proteobacteria bacterium]|nr:alanine racemase [Pseudomonadota bacterium]